MTSAAGATIVEEAVGSAAGGIRKLTDLASDGDGIAGGGGAELVTDESPMSGAR